MKHRLDAAEAMRDMWRGELTTAKVNLGWTEDRAGEIELFLIEVNDLTIEQPNATGGTNLHLQDDYELVWRLVDTRPRKDPDDAWRAGGELATTVVGVMLRSDRLDDKVKGLWRAYPAAVDGPNLVTVPEGLGTWSDIAVNCRHRLQGELA